MIMIFIRLIIAYISIQIKVALFFLKHFEITNSLLAGFAVDMFLSKCNLNIWIRLGVVILIAIFSCILQHLFLPVQIVYGLFGSFMSGIIAYAIFKGNGKFSPVIPLIIVFAATIILNLLSFLKRVDALLEKNEET